ncbi:MULTISPECIES: ATP-binding protein [Asticcacaulis]|uniref:ATP-binding protein n=1 Tax=Asticcacaulis TaxID=76890 RepID=UPI001FD90CB6|nr:MULTISPECIES: ATP-binding protein [Asticcacaulis]
MYGDTAAPDTSGVLRGESELAVLMRGRDWSATALGPVDQWPQSLKTAVRIMLTSRQPIWIGWGPELVYLYNDAYKSIIGGKHPHMLGQPTKVVWQEIWDDIRPLLATAMTGTEGTYVEEQLLIMERNGYPEETYYTFSYSPIPDDDGTPGGIICANTDDTRRVIGERQTATLRDLASFTADARTVEDVCRLACDAMAENLRDLPFAMIYLDGEGDTLRRAGLNGIETDHPAAPGQIDLGAPSPWPCAEACRSHDIQIVSGLDHVFGALPSGAWQKPPSLAAVVPLSAGGVLIAGLNPFRLPDDDYKGFLTLAAGQISASIANAQAYEEARKRAEALAELDRAKTTFFSNISHEFRTPLTLLLAPVEDAVGDPALDPVNRGRLEVAHRNAERLMKLVNVLLDFSRIESGRVTATYQPLDLPAYTADLASNFRSAMDKAGLDYRIAIEPLPQPAYVDADMWEKIILNLLSNAFKYTLSGSVEVALRADNGHAVLAVRDTGPGIPEEELPNLFERFHRVEGATGRSIEGSGIGLALVQELVKLHGGEVSVESRLGEGSTFTVRLPLGRGHLPLAQVREEALPVAGSVRAGAVAEEMLRWLPEDAARQDESPAADAPRIVLADDNADMRDYVCRLLNTEFRVEPVTDGETAWERIVADPPQLVLTDVMMPRLDGFGLLARLRGDERTRDIPVVMLSARAGEEARVEALDAGVDDYLVKPFSARELMAKLRSQLQMSRLRREGEARLARVLESIADGLQVVDANWRFTYMNAAARDILTAQGMAPDDMIGQVYWDVLPGAIGTALEQHLRKVMTERVDIAFENYYTAWHRWYSVRIYPVEDGGLSIYFQDITARKAAEERLVESEERWRGLTEAMPQLVWISRAEDGATIYMNEQWGHYTGEPVANLLGDQWQDFLHPDDRERTALAWAEAIAGRADYDIEYRLRRFDGGYRWFKTRGVSMRDDAGRIRIWYGTCTDIQDSVEARMQAESASRAKSEFLANMSHEIRTPLNAIVGLSHIMLHYKSDPAMQAKYLSTMKDSAETLMQLISDVLDLARIEADSVELDLSPCDLRTLTEECLNISAVKAREKGLECNLDYRIDPGLIFEADALRFKQIVMNLLSNAVKFTAKGSIDVTVWSGPLQDDTMTVSLSVRDTGIGIAADKIEHVFGQFTQADSSISRKFGGSGLGLAISRKLAEMMGGNLTVKSAAGKGATFTLQVRLHLLSGSMAVIGKAAQTVPHPAHKNILLAEDNAANALVATTLLEEFGCRFEVASSGRDAITKWQAGGFDLIMMDVQMPDMDGFETTRRIREHERSLNMSRTPILAMTAHALKGDREKCLQAGMDDYISKPFDTGELERKLDGLLSLIAETERM